MPVRIAAADASPSAYRAFRKTMHNCRRSHQFRRNRPVARHKQLRLHKQLKLLRPSHGATEGPLMLAAKPARPVKRTTGWYRIRSAADR